MSLGRSKLLLIVAAVVGFLLFILPAQLRPEIYPSDDAYFYPQVAWHIAQGHGSTFNQITYTNGYHPLWMIVCVVLAFVAQLDRGALLQLVIIAAQLIGLASLYLFYRLGEQLRLRYLPALLPFLAAFLFSIGMYGSEAHLTVLMLILSLLLLTREHDSTNGLVKISVVLALLFLARLDTIFPIACIFAYVLFVEEYRESFLRRAMLLAIPFSLIAGCYLLYNYLTFGHLMPISGALKSAEPPYTRGFAYLMNRLRHGGGLGTVGLPTAAAAIFAMIAIPFLGIDRKMKRLITMLSIGVLLHAAYVVLMTDHLTHWTWYYLPGVINLCLFTAVVLEWMEARLSASLRRSFAVIVGIASVMIGIGGIMRGWSEYMNPETNGWMPFQTSGSSEKWQLEMAHYIDSQMPPRATLLTFDWPGYIAYHSDLKVIPIDGLMNDFAYQDEIRRTGMHAFVVKHDVRYFLGPEFWFPEPPIGMNNIIAQDSSQRIDFYAPIYRQYVGSVRLGSQDSVGRMREVLRNPNVYYYDYRLWRLPTDSSSWITVPRSARIR